MSTAADRSEAYWNSMKGKMDETTRRENQLLERYNLAERHKIGLLEAEKAKLTRPWHRKKRAAIDAQIEDTKADFFNERTKIIESAEFSRQRLAGEAAREREWEQEREEQAGRGLDERGQVIDQAHAAPDTIDPESWVQPDGQEQDATQVEPEPEGFEQEPEEVEVEEVGVDEPEPEQPAHDEPDAPVEPDYVQRAREQHERDREIQRQRELAQQEQAMDGPGGL